MVKTILRQLHVVTDLIICKIIDIKSEYNILSLKKNNVRFYVILKSKLDTLRGPAVSRVEDGFQ